MKEINGYGMGHFIDYACCVHGNSRPKEKSKESLDKEKKSRENDERKNAMLKGREKVEEFVSLSEWYGVSTEDIASFVKRNGLKISMKFVLDSCNLFINDSRRVVHQSWAHDRRSW